VMLATLAAGGTGLTLTRARTTVYLQRHTSMVLNIQGDGRTRRIGSEHHSHVTYIEFQSVGTVDARILELMHTKKMKLEDLVQDASAIRQLLTMEDTPVEKQLSYYEGAVATRENVLDPTLLHEAD